MKVNCLYYMYLYVYSYHHSSILLQVHYIFIISDACHNITIGRDKLSVVHFSWNVFIVLLILKLFIFDDIILVSLIDIF